jgi:hypothetical protein
MATVTIKTGRNTFKTIVGKRIVRVEHRKQKLIDAFVFWNGRYDDFAYVQKHYLFPLKDVALSKTSITHISGNLIEDYLD